MLIVIHILKVFRKYHTHTRTHVQFIRKINVNFKTTIIQKRNSNKNKNKTNFEINRRKIVVDRA